ncbi:MAG: hypothetical protein K6B28_10605 [Lachnospiraceae bacterium]|nr:hypothetical protein [Lachnospiraceae bacterium]
MKNKEKTVSMIMAVIMSAIMGIIFTVFARHNASGEALVYMPAAPVMYITGILESVITGVLVVLIFPLGKAGRSLCTKYNAVPPSFKFTALNSLPIAVASAVIVSAVCSFISIARSHSHMPADIAPPLMAMWFQNWIRILPVSVIVSYLLAVLISPVIVRATGLSKPPVNVTKSEK